MTNIVKMLGTYQQKMENGQSSNVQYFLVVQFVLLDLPQQSEIVFKSWLQNLEGYTVVP